MKDFLWHAYYNSSTFIFQTCLRMNEVPLWVDEIRWWLERNYFYSKEWNKELKGNKGDLNESQNK